MPHGVVVEYRAAVPGVAEELFTACETRMTHATCLCCIAVAEYYTATNHTGAVVLLL